MNHTTTYSEQRRFLRMTDMSHPTTLVSEHNHVSAPGACKSAHTQVNLDMNRTHAPHFFANFFIQISNGLRIGNHKRYVPGSSPDPGNLASLVE